MLWSSVAGLPKGVLPQPSSVTSDNINSPQDALPLTWMRLCPLCKAVLTKSRLSESIHCPCGWEWEGRAKVIDFPALNSRDKEVCLTVK